MNTSKISTEQTAQYKRISRALKLVFKIGIPLGLVVMILGTLVANLLDPENFRHQVLPLVNAFSELIMAVSCIALSLDFALDGYVSIMKHSKSTLHAISGIFVYALGSVITLSVAVGLMILACRHFTLK